MIAGGRTLFAYTGRHQHYRRETPLIDTNSVESLTTADFARIAGPAFSTALHSALQVAQQAIQNAIKSTGDPAIDINRRGKYLQSTIDTEFIIIPSNPLHTTNDKGQRQLCRWKVLHTPSAGSSLEQTFARTESCVEQVVLRHGARTR